jgi:hypothetical protein
MKIVNSFSVCMGNGMFHLYEKNYKLSIHQTSQFSDLLHLFISKSEQFVIALLLVSSYIIDFEYIVT